HRRGVFGPGQLGRFGFSGLVSQNAVLPPRPVRADKRVPVRAASIARHRAVVGHGAPPDGQCHPLFHRLPARPASLLSGDEMLMPGAKLQLNPAQLPFVSAVDGRRTIRQILDGVAQRAELAKESRAELEGFGRKLFQELWRLDFLAMALNSESAGTSA